MKNSEKIIIGLVSVFTVLLALFLSALVFNLVVGSAGRTISIIIASIVSLGVIVGGIAFINYILKRPSKLTADGKPLTNSKTFWSAFLIFILTSLQEVVGLNGDASIGEISELIGNMDFSNILVAVLSIVVIFIRYFDVQKLINSIIPDEE